MRPHGSRRAHSRRYTAPTYGFTEPPPFHEAAGRDRRHSTGRPDRACVVASENAVRGPSLERRRPPSDGGDRGVAFRDAPPLRRAMPLGRTAPTLPDRRGGPRLHAHRGLHDQPRGGRDSGRRRRDPSRDRQRDPKRRDRLSRRPHLHPTGVRLPDLLLGPHAPLRPALHDDQDARGDSARRIPRRSGVGLRQAQPPSRLHRPRPRTGPRPRPDGRVPHPTRPRRTG